MTINELLALTSCAVLATIGVGTCPAVEPSERLLPMTTKAFISTQDVEEVRTKFQETQFGEMAHDPVMQPFISDLKQQIATKLDRAGRRLGLKWEDLEGVYAGEVAAALIQPDPNDKMSHATALVVDVTGKKKEVDALLGKIERNQQANKAARSKIAEAGVEITVFEQPARSKGQVPQRSYQCLAGNQLIFSDDEATVREIVQRQHGDARNSLASLRAFQRSLEHCGDASNGIRHHVRWFIEPLGYAEVSRAIQGGKTRRGIDILNVLQSQGFAAIEGMGGLVYFATDAGGLIVDDRPEILHRTFVYAPAIKRMPNDTSTDKYDLAMRMLDFPNSKAPGDLEPQSWSLPDIGSYLTFNWKMRQAFDYSETLVDALLDDKGIFKEMWRGKKTGADGPEIDIYADLLDHLSERATLLSDIKLPVDTKSERHLAFFELKNPASTAAVAKTLEKNFKLDGEVRPRDIRGHVVWDINREIIDDDAPKAKGKKEEKGKDEKRPIAQRRMAVTAYSGHLLISTHWEFIEEFLNHQSNHNDLSHESDYQRVRSALAALGAKLDSIHYFSRTSESYRANYELFKQGKLPVANTILARLLNQLVGPHEAERDKPEFDGSKLPEFELIEKYLGPGGAFAQTKDDGWWIVGCLQKKQ